MLSGVVERRSEGGDDGEEKRKGEGMKWEDGQWGRRRGVGGGEQWEGRRESVGWRKKPAAPPRSDEEGVLNVRMKVLRTKSHEET